MLDPTSRARLWISQPHWISQPCWTHILTFITEAVRLCGDSVGPAETSVTAQLVNDTQLVNGNKAHTAA
jgi:hypothetical protein